VYYSGVFGEDEKLQSTGYSKIERPRSFTDSVQIIKDSVHLRKSSDNTLTNSNQSALQLPGSLNNSHQFSKKRVESLKVNPQELQNIFSEVFSTTDVLKKIQERLTSYVAKEENASSDMVEYQIDTDYKAITDYMIGTLTTLLNKKAEDKAIEEEQKIDNNKQNILTKNRASSFKESKGLLDVDLSESVYGPSYRESFTNSLRNKDPNTQSFNSSTECKNLSSTLGVKLVLKNEGGKFKLVSVPTDYSIIGSVGPIVEQNKKDYESVQQKEEKVEEPVYNVVLSLKKTTSVEKKHHEFSNQMLKANLHDLDEDLPAPYDKKVVQKFEKGDLAESLYEKIE